MGLNHRLISQTGLVLCLVISLSILNAAHAEVLPDPTQPPSALLSPSDADAYPSAPVLQSVMLSPTHKAAVINGKKVMLGGKYEGATLIKLNDHQAILRNPDNSLQKLQMNDAVIKRVITPVTKKKN